VPILQWTPGASPEAPGTLQFFEQGADPSTGFQVSSKGAILSAISSAWSAATAAAVVASAIVTADAFDRWRLRADGRMDWGDGAGPRDTNLYRSGPAALATDGFFAMGSGQSSGQFSVFGGDLVIGTAGQGMKVKEGTNASMGTTTLVAGTVVVNTTRVTANSRVFLTAQTSGAGAGALRVSARTAGTSFTITSTSGTDTSQVAWLILEPAP
jgi:hypothetical protein